MKRCLLLLVDGLRPDVAEEELRAGRLPHLTEMLAHGSTGRGVTAFPSSTTVSYLPFLTGCTPGTCNVPSIRWLDRRTYGGRWWKEREEIRSYCGYQAGRIDRDLPRDVPTIFELVPESLAIFTPIARGLTRERDPAGRLRGWLAALGHYLYWNQPSDDVAAKHLLRAIEGPSRFVFCQFPAVDLYTHQGTPDGHKVRRALHRVDRVVGTLRARLAEREELHETLILLVSDHGASAVHTHLDLADWFRAQGVPTLAHPVIWERAPRAAVMVAGNGSAMVYAQPDRPRAERWPVEALRRPETFGARADLVEALVREAAVALVVGASEAGGLRVVSREGEAEVRERDGHVAYRPIYGDPLGLGEAWTGSAREWLERSWDGPYPDAPVQLLDQFRAERTGDLLVIAREGYDFRRRFEIPEHKSGHGSLFRTHMQVPIWSSEPRPAGPLRTVDLYPAMLDWLGVTPPAGLDGDPVWLPRSAPAPAVAQSRSPSEFSAPAPETQRVPAGRSEGP